MGLEAAKVTNAHTFRLLYECRVGQGKDVLTKYSPGWQWRLTVDEIDFRKPKRDILSLLYGSGRKGRKVLKKEGFTTRQQLIDLGLRTEWRRYRPKRRKASQAMLTELWREQVSRLRRLS